MPPNPPPTYDKPFNYRRLRTFDYSRGASLFITITTEPRRLLFGRVTATEMVLSPLGRVVLEVLETTFTQAKGFRLYGRVVMPDHVHFRLYLEPGVDAKRAPGLINSLVGRFKSFTNHLYYTNFGGHGTLWQQGYHDWLCRNREMIGSVERYIAYNPLKWWLRHGEISPRRGGSTDGGGVGLGSPRRGGSTDGGGVGPGYRGGLLALREPLTSPRLGGLEYWRGLGALELLDAPLTMVSLRVSQRCTPADIAKLKARLLAKVEGLVIISGFISAGERAIEAALLEHPAGRLVKVKPYALAHDYNPSVSVMPAIAQGRFAEIARGNSPEEISRGACLVLNARIIDIADRSAYMKPGELAWLK